VLIAFVVESMKEGMIWCGNNRLDPVLSPSQLFEKAESGAYGGEVDHSVRAISEETIRCLLHM
jgi:hypothetical protein